MFTLFLFLISHFTFAAAVTCNAGDKKALLQLRFKSPLWNATTIKRDCCTWQGISCTPSGRVNSLNIPNAQGDIPSRPLCQLTALESLTLSTHFFGSITGNVPKCIGTLLIHLRKLDLSFNRLLGKIPAELGNLHQLEYLDLSNNNFDGGIPAQLCNLKLLKHLDLSRGLPRSSHAQGSLPTCLGLNLNLLEKLILSNLFLTGDIPASLGKLSNLKELTLDGNSFSSSLPPALGSLSKLQIFRLYGPGITGSIPSSFNGLVSMTDFYFQDMPRLGGTLPDFSNWKNIDRLAISNTSITGPLPASLHPNKLPKLQVFDLSQNALTGKIPSSLAAALPNLKRFILSFNKLTGPIPGSLGSLKLDIFNVKNNRLSGAIPAELGALGTGLGRIADFSNNRLTGRIPKGLSGMPKVFFQNNPGLCGIPLKPCK